MSTSVVVPWRSQGDPHRERAWELVQANWTGWNVWTADDLGEPFSRAASINRAVEEHPADVYVVADADILINAEQVRTAVALAGYKPGLVVAFDRWAHLTEAGTRDILDGYLGSWEPFVDVTYPSLSACICVSRETWETTGGFDPSFRGWGGEDVAFEIVCRTLAGPTRRIPGTAWHLFHESDPHRPAGNFELLDEYGRAADDPEALRALMASV